MLSSFIVGVILAILAVLTVLAQKNQLAYRKIYITIIVILFMIFSICLGWMIGFLTVERLLIKEGINTVFLNKFIFRIDWDNMFEIFAIAVFIVLYLFFGLKLAKLLRTP